MAGRAGGVASSPHSSANKGEAARTQLPRGHLENVTCPLLSSPLPLFPPLPQSLPTLSLPAFSLYLLFRELHQKYTKIVSISSPLTLDEGCTENVPAQQQLVECHYIYSPPPPFVHCSLLLPQVSGEGGGEGEGRAECRGSTRTGTEEQCDHASY